MDSPHVRMRTGIMCVCVCLCVRAVYSLIYINMLIIQILINCWVDFFTVSNIQHFQHERKCSVAKAYIILACVLYDIWYIY
jgi:hypothetical protein